MLRPRRLPCHRRSYTQAVRVLLALGILLQLSPATRAADPYGDPSVNSQVWSNASPSIPIVRQLPPVNQAGETSPRDVQETPRPLDVRINGEFLGRAAV